ncbi:hypothetical protein [Stenotrophomonas maltophilia]|uniref:hypothetical protein n=1 Tax=Stenotrophomonas maltophilia TaxID=40324 RepID=UPI0024473101|nr:hypothetical protein [Stenotrophomonas maltophilia]MDH0740920.1 hypothetical protein [Stenotrophomonas maltophilia]MDH1328356.1 hypothetical protein [Stenotrophomonas maltophilia]
MNNSYSTEKRVHPWNHPRPPTSQNARSNVQIPISVEDFASCWGARIHADGRFFTYGEVIVMDYHHVWTVTDAEPAHIGVAAMPGDFGDMYYGFCVTEKPWDWDFYQSAGYAVLTDAGDAADREFYQNGKIPLPRLTETVRFP